MLHINYMQEVIIHFHAPISNLIKLLRMFGMVNF